MPLNRPERTVKKESSIILQPLLLLPYFEKCLQPEDHGHALGGHAIEMAENLERYALGKGSKVKKGGDAC